MASCPDVLGGMDFFIRLRQDVRSSLQALYGSSFGAGLERAVDGFNHVLRYRRGGRLSGGISTLRLVGALKGGLWLLLVSLLAGCSCTPVSRVFPKDEDAMQETKEVTARDRVGVVEALPGNKGSGLLSLPKFMLDVIFVAST